MSNYPIGQEFDLLVYAVQVYNTKIEVLYNVISGKVGKLENIQEITETIPNRNEFATQLFIRNTTTNNYLFYKFNNQPIGGIELIK